MILLLLALQQEGPTSSQNKKKHSKPPPAPFCSTFPECCSGNAVSNGSHASNQESSGGGAWRWVCRGSGCFFQIKPTQALQLKFKEHLSMDPKDAAKLFTAANHIEAEHHINTVEAFLTGRKAATCERHGKGCLGDILCDNTQVDMFMAGPPCQPFSCQRTDRYSTRWLQPIIIFIESADLRENRSQNTASH